jgi:hypothetical protein
MVAKKVIAWSKATLHALIVPAVFYGFIPYGWVFALAWLTLVTALYTTALRDRPAAYPFALIAIGVTLLVIPVLVGTIGFENATRTIMGVIQ